MLRAWLPGSWFAPGLNEEEAESGGKGEREEPSYLSASPPLASGVPGPLSPSPTRRRLEDNARIIKGYKAPSPWDARSSTGVVFDRLSNPNASAWFKEN
jgi:hypothetical protein